MTANTQSLDAAAIERLVGRLSTKELAAFAAEIRALERELDLAGPVDDDELHQWVLDTIGIDIPRNAVCADHDAPFKFFADIYFERVKSVILMANRGGSKTFLVALLHLVNSKFKPKTESATVGAIEQQARRCYIHLMSLLKLEGNVNRPEDNADVATSIMSETQWKNGSKVEVLPGTMAAVNGPHPQKVHFDEVELADVEVFYESRNMSTSKGKVAAQDIITSTRKGPYGMMQRLITEIEDAKRGGFPAPYELYQWCAFETAAPVDNCICAVPDHPDPCNCDSIVKGKWDEHDEAGEARPRTLKDVCKGRLYRSQGWMPYNDIVKNFLNNPRSVWEAQQECIKPSTEGLVIKRFVRGRHCLKNYIPDMSNGPIFMSVDWGGGNPHAVNWYQLLRNDIDAIGYEGNVVTLKQGSTVCFDEIYRTEIGNIKLAELVLAREAEWAKLCGGSFVVTKRFCDPANKSARLDWGTYNPPLRTMFVATRDVKEHIKLCESVIDDDVMYVDIRCEMWIDEIEAWHYPKKRQELVYDPEIPVDDFNHCMSNWRYLLANLFHIERWARSRGMTSIASISRPGITKASIPATADVPNNGRGSNKDEGLNMFVKGGLTWRP